MDSIFLLICIVVLLVIGFCLLRLLRHIVQLHAQLRLEQMRRDTDDRHRV